jgi:hypothetical protein
MDALYQHSIEGQMRLYPRAPKLSSLGCTLAPYLRKKDARLLDLSCLGRARYSRQHDFQQETRLSWAETSAIGPGSGTCSHASPRPVSRSEQTWTPEKAATGDDFCVCSVVNAFAEMKNAFAKAGPLAARFKSAGKEDLSGGHQRPTLICERFPNGSSQTCSFAPCTYSYLLRC